MNRDTTAPLCASGYGAPCRADDTGTCVGCGRRMGPGPTVTAGRARDEAIKALAADIYDAIRCGTGEATKSILGDALRAFADAIREDVLNTEIATWPAVNRNTPPVPPAP